MSVRLIIHSLALFLALPLFSCSQKKYVVEDELYQCMTDVYASNGISLIELSDSIETFFIGSGLLEDPSGESKVNVYKEIARTGEGPTLPSNSFSTRLTQLQRQLYFTDSCISASNIDSVTLHNSVFYKAQEKAQELFKKPGGIHPKQAAKLTLETFSSDDFEHPYFRAQFLVSILLTAGKDKAYVRSAPDQTLGPKTDGVNHVSLRIDLSQKSKLLVDGKPENLENLEDLIFEHISEDNESRKPYIKILVHQNTSYSSLDACKNMIDLAYNRLRNEVSKTKFNREFNKLNAKQQQEIIEMTPLKVKEVVK